MAPLRKRGRCMPETRLKLVSINPGKVTPRLFYYLARYEANTHRGMQRGMEGELYKSSIPQLKNGLESSRKITTEAIIFNVTVKAIHYHQHQELLSIKCRGIFNCKQQTKQKFLQS
jgi:hypothetical protein